MLPLWVCTQVLREPTTTISADDTDAVLGIVLVYYEITESNSGTWVSIATNLGTPYYWISLSLNILLTLLIVIRLITHRRNTRIISEGPLGTSGLYKALMIMFIESCTLYATTFLLFVGPWCANSWVADVFFPILIEAQVCSISVLP